MPSKAGRPGNMFRPQRKTLAKGSSENNSSSNTRVFLFRVACVIGSIAAGLVVWLFIELVTDQPESSRLLPTDTSPNFHTNIQRNNQGIPLTELAQISDHWSKLWNSSASIDASEAGGSSHNNHHNNHAGSSTNTDDWYDPAQFKRTKLRETCQTFDNVCSNSQRFHVLRSLSEGGQSSQTRTFEILWKKTHFVQRMTRFHTPLPTRTDVWYTSDEVLNGDAGFSRTPFHRSKKENHHNDDDDEDDGSDDERGDRKDDDFSSNQCRFVEPSNHMVLYFPHHHMLGHFYHDVLRYYYVFFRQYTGLIDNDGNETHYAPKKNDPLSQNRKRKNNDDKRIKRRRLRSLLVESSILNKEQQSELKGMSEFEKEYLIELNVSLTDHFRNQALTMMDSDLRRTQMYILLQTDLRPMNSHKLFTNAFSDYPLLNFDDLLNKVQCNCYRHLHFCGFVHDTDIDGEYPTIEDFMLKQNKLEPTKKKKNDVNIKPQIKHMGLHPRNVGVPNTYENAFVWRDFRNYFRQWQYLSDPDLEHDLVKMKINTLVQVFKVNRTSINGAELIRRWSQNGGDLLNKYYKFVALLRRNGRRKWTNIEDTRKSCNREFSIHFKNNSQRFDDYTDFLISELDYFQALETESESESQSKNGRMMRMRLVCYELSVEHHWMYPRNHALMHSIADMAIGIHGAQLTHGIWLKPYAFILELLPWVHDKIMYGQWTRTIDTVTPLGIIFYKTDLNHFGYRLPPVKSVPKKQQCPPNAVDCWDKKRWDSRDFITEWNHIRRILVFSFYGFGSEVNTMKSSSDIVENSGGFFQNSFCENGMNEFIELRKSKALPKWMTEIDFVVYNAECPSSKKPYVLKKLDSS